MAIFIQYQVIWFNIPAQAEYIGLSITIPISLEKNYFHAEILKSFSRNIIFKT